MPVRAGGEWSCCHPRARTAIKTAQGADLGGQWCPPAHSSCRFPETHVVITNTTFTGNCPQIPVL